MLVFRFGPFILVAKYKRARNVEKAQNRDASYNLSLIKVDLGGRLHTEMSDG